MHDNGRVFAKELERMLPIGLVQKLRHQNELNSHLK